MLGLDVALEIVFKQAKSAPPAWISGRLAIGAGFATILLLTVWLAFA
jgi:hypothetical protein